MWTRTKESTVDNPQNGGWIIRFNDQEIGRVSYAPERPGVEPWAWCVHDVPMTRGRAWTEEAALNAIREAHGQKAELAATAS